MTLVRSPQTRTGSSSRIARPDGRRNPDGVAPARPFSFAGSGRADRATAFVTGTLSRPAGSDPLPLFAELAALRAGPARRFAVAPRALEGPTGFGCLTFLLTATGVTIVPGLRYYFGTDESIVVGTPMSIFATPATEAIRGSSSALCSTSSTRPRSPQRRSPPGSPRRAGSSKLDSSDRIRAHFGADAAMRGMAPALAHAVQRPGFQTRRRTWTAESIS